MIRYAAFTAAALVATVSQAALLGPGGSVFTPAGQAYPGSFTAVSPGQVSPFTNANFNGVLVSQVYSNLTGNPFPGGYTFVYQLTNDASSHNALERLTINGFAGFQTDVTWITATGTAPVASDRSLGAGDVVGNFFGAFAPGYTTLTPGSTTAFLLIHTDATNFQLNIASVIDGLTANVPAWAPAVPTPGAAGLMGMGLLAAARRRRA